jgi:hypothetical protein
MRESCSCGAGRDCESDLRVSICVHACLCLHQEMRTCRSCFSGTKRTHDCGTTFLKFSFWPSCLSLFTFLGTDCHRVFQKAPLALFMLDSCSLFFFSSFLPFSSKNLRMLFTREGETIEHNQACWISGIIRLTGVFCSCFGRKTRRAA